MMERYVTAKELAELMGLSTRTIKRMTAEGMPSETWGMAHVRRYRPSEVLDWARVRGPRRSDKMGPVRSPDGAGNTEPGDTHQLKE